MTATRPPKRELCRRIKKTKTTIQNTNKKRKTPNITAKAESATDKSTILEISSAMKSPEPCNTARKCTPITPKAKTITMYKTTETISITTKDDPTDEKDNEKTDDKETISEEKPNKQET